MTRARGRWVFLPVTGAPVLHAPVLRSDLLSALKLPLDGGLTVRGRRVFGANKTVRGALVMGAGCVGAAVGLSRIAWYRSRLPAELRGRPLVLGLAVAAGTIGGELPNSFVKRQMGVQPGAAGGAAFRVLDQGDLVLGIALALRPWYRMPVGELATSFALVSAIHAGVNVVGYAIGARETFV
jgi:CDP-2,3-bis-(O-geranylgeranyl)-sn-glycerol synthase